MENELIYSEETFQGLGVYQPYKSGNNDKFDDFSKKILDFKRKHLSVITYFHDRLVTEIIPPGNYAICIAPSSSMTPVVNGKYTHQSAVALLCERLCKTLNAINASSSLIRTEDKVKSHLGGSKNIEDHLKTLKLSSDEFIKGRDVILLDDVLTTGHTIKSCYQTLVTGNPNRIAIVVLAYTRRGNELTEDIEEILNEFF